MFIVCNVYVPFPTINEINKKCSNINKQCSKSIKIYSKVIKNNNSYKQFSEIACNHFRGKSFKNILT